MAIELADSNKRLHKKAIKQWNAAFEGNAYVNHSVPSQSSCHQSRTSPIALVLTYKPLHTLP